MLADDDNDGEPVTLPHVDGDELGDRDPEPDID